MRILHVTDTFAPRVGGIERQVEALGRYQMSQGHDVRVLTAARTARDPIPTPDVTTPDSRSLLVGTATDVEADFDIVRSNVPYWVTCGVVPWQNLMARRGLKDVDLVHAHLSVCSPLTIHAARLASRRGIPVAITVHSFLPPQPYVFGLANFWYGVGPIRAAWSAVSTAAATSLGTVLARTRDISVVPNLVDTTWWHPSGPGRLSDPTNVRIVTVGRLARRKRVAELFSALAQVRQRVPSSIGIEVTVVGEGPQHEKLTEQMAELGIADWVTLVGQRRPDEVRALLQQSDFFVAPARRESFGIAALEARAAGLPIIGFSDNGLSDFLTQDVDGILVDTDEQLTDAITDLVLTPRRLEALREVTLAKPPGLSGIDAVQAVSALYDRARALVDARVSVTR